MWASKKQHHDGFERGEQERNNIIMVLKEVRRRETAFIWYWTRWAGGNNIIMVLKEVSREETAFIWFWARLARK
jgi:hypothetical protein